MIFRITILLAAIFMFGSSLAQKLTMNFETGDFASVLEKAKKENKIVFVDGFTTWCGPCKMMTKNTFTNDSVANYFNERFVNYKLDMEKGEGIEFAKKYEVHCYPNLLVLDASGNLIHRSAGYLDPKTFMAFGRDALTPGKNFNDKKTLFERDLNEKNIADYVLLLQSACFNSSLKINEYLEKIQPEALSKPANFNILEDFILDPENPQIIYMLKNISDFEKQNGKAVLETKVARLGVTWFESRMNKEALTGEKYEALKSEYRSLSWPYSDRVIFEMDLRAAKQKDKSTYYALAADQFLKYNNSNPNALNSMAWKFYEDVINKDQLKAGLAMSKRACELEGHYQNLDTYAALLYKTENYKEADIWATKAIEAAKKVNLKKEDYQETLDLQKKIKAKLK
jgi:thioredoxin-related protein